MSAQEWNQVQALQSAEYVVFVALLAALVIGSIVLLAFELVNRKVR